MFTGIVEEVGEVEAAVRRHDVLAVRIRARAVTAGLPRGGSIAVDGCCLTAVETDGDGFACDLTAETLDRTAFAQRLVPGALVNLERPMRADGRFDGHIVQGHVDGVGEILGLERSGEAAALSVAVPPHLERYLVEKGSIAVDGISLTVAGLRPGGFSVAVIPYTLDHTNLRAARPGDRVNLEIDVIAKYVERLIAPASSRA
ncbi:MAG TPA: riboflavin synthase [Vicinamibacteria bacterium]|nr:riboflavin synthase [Vicinamibacteria bacterium]